MLNLFTEIATEITELPSLGFSFVCPNQSISFNADNTAANQPTISWFLFLKHKQKRENMYFMLRYNHDTVGNFSVELAT
jgi:hypothetical protein